jgi:hypothetical protein
MYSDADLDAAVGEGAITAEAVSALRAFVARRRAAPAVDEEHFRLLTGFNDIFVSIAAVLLLIAVAWLAGMVAPVVGAAAEATVSWGLAEYFTRRRRMALPSILLLATFTAGVFCSGALLLKAVMPPATETTQITAGAVLAVAGATVHWLRFRVPITVAVGACAAVASVVTLLIALVPGLGGRWPVLLFAGGLTLFALAMHWDMSDRTRTTRRSDVAFWLHLSAAPLIVHPTFSLLGLLGSGEANLWRAGVAVALYVGLAVVALVVDRRALLVSALFYVLYAISALLRATSDVNASLALTALVVGSALLLLSAFWHPVRRTVLGLMPGGVRVRVPAT